MHGIGRSPGDIKEQRNWKTLLYANSLNREDHNLIFTGDRTNAELASHILTRVEVKTPT